ncbi:ABC transporter substrate-binding protein [Pseudonocardia xishanensis]|uniref:SsuA/THI5-like domain-containing protein n=1 Tax=Pseudonocardia xishanensis TaxID=630995 RepID=A0ABP8RV96_9PSEU
MNVRRFGWLVCGMVTAVVGAGCGTVADTTGSGSDLIPIQLGLQTGGAATLPIVIAERDGLFAKHGIAVEQVETKTDLLNAAFASKSIEVAFQTPVFYATAFQRGQKLQPFCGLTQRDWATIVVRADSGVPVAAGTDYRATTAALSGKVVGVAALGGSNDRALQSIVGLVGQDPRAFSTIAVGAGAPAVAAFRAGQIDALVASPFTNQALVGSGEGKIVFGFADNAPDQYRQAIYTAFGAPADWLATNRNAAQRFCAAMEDAYGVIRAQGPSGGLDSLLESEYGLAEPVTRAEVVKAGGPLDQFGTQITCEQIGSALSLALANGVLKEPVPTCEEILWKP